MNDKTKWGVIGLGKIAQKFTHDLNFFEGSVLQGVASGDEKDNFFYDWNFDECQRRRIEAELPRLSK